MGGDFALKTFKRDYVWLGDLSSAKRVMEQLPAWFEDYEEKAPHKALKMMAPREYIRNCSLAGSVFGGNSNNVLKDTNERTLSFTSRRAGYS